MALVNGKCSPVYPHQFIKVNTLFEVIRQHGGRTAWSDKHPAYDVVNGPSGTGMQDLFTPEVDSNDAVTGQDTTNGFHSVQRNDFLKDQSILNEIDELDSTGQHESRSRSYDLRYEFPGRQRRSETGPRQQERPARLPDSANLFDRRLCGCVREDAE
jgi:hypothetical protein